MTKRSRLEIAEGVAWLTLDDGKVNALAPELLGEIDAALDEAADAGAVVVIRGREGIFSAGFDFTTFAKGPEAGIAMVRAGAELVLRLLAHDWPVMTVCTGHAYPAGAFLMMASDQRLGIAGDWKIGMNEVAIAMTVPRFAVELARHRLSPPGWCRVLTGAMLGPEQAARVGYLDEVVEPGALDARVRDETERLRGLDARAFAETKARVNAPAIAAIREALQEELREVT